MVFFTKDNLFAGLKIFVITIIILVNLVLFRNNLKSPIIRTSSEVDIFTEQPTGTVIPHSTVASHVQDVIKQRFEERAKQVHRVCSIPGHIAASVTKPKELINLPSIGLLWCPTFEAGNSNWVDMFCKESLNAPSDSVCDIDILRKNHLVVDYFSKKRNTLNNGDLGLPFMTVRNPLVRLLSTYRSLFEGASDLNQYIEIGENIVQNFRNVESRLSDREIVLLLKEAMFEISKQPSDDLLKLKYQNPYLNPPGPTFSEFVKWVLKHGYANPYIEPYYKRCAPCSVKYNILRQEKLYEESDHLFNVIEKSYLNFEFSMSFNDNRYTEICLLKYYKALYGVDLDELYDKLFKVDCELFSYPCKATMSLISVQHLSTEIMNQC